MILVLHRMTLRKSLDFDWHWIRFPRKKKDFGKGCFNHFCHGPKNIQTDFLDDSTVFEIPWLSKNQKFNLSFVFIFSKKYSKFFIFQTEPRYCTACGDAIADRYVLEVGGCTWHASCLRCCVCLTPLDSQPSCYLRDRQIYCRADYTK